MREEEQNMEGEYSDGGEEGEGDGKATGDE